MVEKVEAVQQHLADLQLYIEQRDSEKRQLKKPTKPVKPLIQISGAKGNKIKEDPIQVEIRGGRPHRQRRLPTYL